MPWPWAVPQHKEERVSASKAEKDSPPVEKSQQESSHRTFSEFLDCVRNFSVDEKRASLKLSWMAEPVGPCRELFTVEGKEPLKYIWDHLAEFKKGGRKAIQAHLAEHLDDKINSGVIANAVWSCMLEHRDKPELSEEKRKLPVHWEDETAYPSGHTKTDAASILGIDRKTVSNWIDNGTINPTPSGRISIPELKRVMDKG